MSVFKVELRRISKVWTHPNADALDLAKVEGLEYQFVVRRGSFKENDMAIYLPLDSIVPQATLQKMGLEGRLAGAEKNRVKTIRLRQEISQGIVASPVELLGENWQQINPDAITELLGVTKYEPPATMGSGAMQFPLPNGVEHYDIENAERFPDVLELLMQQEVYITEKLDGTSFSLTKTVNTKYSVNTHHHSVVEIPDASKKNIYLEAARRQNVYEFVDAVAMLYPIQQVTVRGELCGLGIQKNRYRLKELRIFFFDIKVDEKYLDPVTFDRICHDNIQPTVPVLAMEQKLSDILGIQTIRSYSDGESRLCGTRREGVVIKPMKEQWHNKIGRLYLKQKSPRFLAKEDD